MVRETREIELAPGTTELTWDDLPDTIQSETVDVRAPTGVTLVAQRFEETLPGPVGLAALLRNQEVRARPRDDTPFARERGVRHEWSGAIVSLEGGLVLRVGKTLTSLPPSAVTLVDPSKGVPKRRLVLVFSTPNATRAKVSVSGIVERIVAHAPRYMVTLDRAAHELRVRGTVAITNASSTFLEGAKLFFGDTRVEPSFQRREDRPLDLASTWLVSEGRIPTPFELAEPLHFSGVGVAEPLIVDKSHLPFVERSRASISQLDDVREKPEGPSLLPVSLSWTVDKAALALATKLPAGEALLTDGTPNAAPGVFGNAVLFQQDSASEVTVDARATSLRVESKLLSGGATNDCIRTSKWEHAIPSDALAHGTFVLDLPFEKKTLEARVQKAEGVTVETFPERSRILVTRLTALEAKKLGLAVGAPRKIVVTYKTNRCR